MNNTPNPQFEQIKSSAYGLFEYLKSKNVGEHGIVYNDSDSVGSIIMDTATTIRLKEKTLTIDLVKNGRRYKLEINEGLRGVSEITYSTGEGRELSEKAKVIAKGEPTLTKEDLAVIVDFPQNLKNFIDRHKENILSALSKTKLGLEGPTF